MNIEYRIYHLINIYNREMNEAVDRNNSEAARIFGNFVEDLEDLVKKLKQSQEATK